MNLGSDASSGREVDPRFGEISRLEHPQTGQKLFAKVRKEKNFQDFVSGVQVAQQRQTWNCAHLPRLVQVEKDEETLTVITCFEYLPSNLFQQRARFKSASEHMIFLHHLLKALDFLERRQLNHGDLAPEFISFDPGAVRYVLNDRLDQQTLPLETLRARLDAKKPLFAPPCVFQACFTSQPPRINFFKAEVFAAGMIFLAVLVEEKVLRKLYNTQQGTFDSQLFASVKENVTRKFFSKPLFEIFGKFVMNSLLAVESSRRPSPSQALVLLKQIIAEYNKSFSGSTSTRISSTSTNEQSPTIVSPIKRFASPQPPPSPKNKSSDSLKESHQGQKKAPASLFQPKTIDQGGQQNNVQSVETLDDLLYEPEESTEQKFQSSVSLKVNDSQSRPNIYLNFESGKDIDPVLAGFISQTDFGFDAPISKNAVSSSKGPETQTQAQTTNFASLRGLETQKHETFEEITATPSNHLPGSFIKKNPGYEELEELSTENFNTFGGDRFKDTKLPKLSFAKFSYPTFNKVPNKPCREVGTITLPFQSPKTLISAFSTLINPSTADSEFKISQKLSANYSISSHILNPTSVDLSTSRPYSPIRPQMRPERPAANVFELFGSFEDLPEHGVEQSDSESNFLLPPKFLTSNDPGFTSEVNLALPDQLPPENNNDYPEIGSFARKAQPLQTIKVTRIRIGNS